MTTRVVCDNTLQSSSQILESLSQEIIST